jgi:hypothetical protein
MEIYEFFDLSDPILGDLDQRVLQRKRGIMDSFVEPDLVESFRPYAARKMCMKLL